MKPFTLFMLISIVFLTGCLPTYLSPTPSWSLSETPALPTDIPTAFLFSSPTFTETTSDPTPLAPSITVTTFEASSTATSTPIPLPSLLPPTLLPTPIAQPKADSAAIQFYAPGPLSKVTSPLTFYGYAIPGHDNLAQAELFGEDGRLLASELLRLGDGATWVFFSWRFPFDVRGVGELGRLSLSTRDAYGRLTALQSVHLLLLSMGPEIINPPEERKERCVLETPTARQILSKGQVNVRGKMRPYNDLPIVVELIGRNGQVLAAQAILVLPDPRNLYVPFSVELTYSVTSFTDALLTVRQDDHRIPGIMYLFSRQIYLNP
ncbi:MAG: hypothetical protein NZL98_03520 [Anaerolineales bacterium]|nr:hypothetical protein [Anaerolineales bacterium]